MKKLLYTTGLFAITVLFITSCNDEQLKEWYFEEPPLPANATVFGNESYNVGIDENSSFFVKLKGEPPFDFTYSDGEQEITITDIDTSVYEIPVMPDYTTYYKAVAVSNVMGEGSIETDSAVVNVFSVKNIFQSNFNSYVQRSENGKGRDHSSDELLLLKNASDEYARTSFYSFDLSSFVDDIASEDEFFFTFSILYSNNTTQNSIIVEASDVSIDNTIDWGSQPLDELFEKVGQSEHKSFGTDKDASTLIENQTFDLTSYVQSLIADGKSSFTLRLTLKDQNAAYLRIGSNNNSNESFRPKLEIKGQVYKPEINE
ncbi:DNRLRE domain-containing protein [Marinifilum sp.]|uniref:DNRLRE domain-containing protein n=1 Tax=Marinifilum sp. TaxID=2033137 RepID=UPI003BAB53AE